MRGLIFGLLLWVGYASAEERLEIEMVPVRVTDPFGEVVTPSDAIPNALARIHRALAALGVRPNEYNLSVSNEAEFLECSRRTILVEQTCTHNAHGTLGESYEAWSTFVQKLPSPSTGTVVLWVLLLPEEWPWIGYSGIVSRTVASQNGVASITGRNGSARDCPLTVRPFWRTNLDIAFALVTTRTTRTTRST